MFADKKTDQSAKAEGWLEGLSRRHPAAFTAGLVVLTALIVLGLLYKPGETVVLYEGF